LGEEKGEVSSFQDFAAEKRRHLPDASLVAKVLTGDRLAFDTLVLRYTPLVLGYLSSRLSHSHEAEDLAQDVFLQAYSNVSQLRNPNRFSAWLLAIAHNRLISFRRSVKRRPHVSPSHDEEGAASALDTAPDPSPGPDRMAADALTRFAVLEEITRMNKRYSDVLFARLVGEDTTEEICHRLKLTPDAVRARTLRGMRKLRQRLKKRGLDLSSATGRPLPTDTTP
jgi:RNA polymerase sigma-70 factor (ECF subfamily)